MPTSEPSSISHPPQAQKSWISPGDILIVTLIAFLTVSSFWRTPTSPEVKFNLSSLYAGLHVVPLM